MEHFSDRRSAPEAKETTTLNNGLAERACVRLTRSVLHSCQMVIECRGASHRTGNKLPSAHKGNGREKVKG